MRVDHAGDVLHLPDQRFDFAGGHGGLSVMDGAAQVHGKPLVCLNDRRPRGDVLKDSADAVPGAGHDLGVMRSAFSPKVSATDRLKAVCVASRWAPPPLPGSLFTTELRKRIVGLADTSPVPTGIPKVLRAVCASVAVCWSTVPMSRLVAAPVARAAAGIAAAAPIPSRGSPVASVTSDP